MLLNLRSHRLNYHAAINALWFWDNRVPKRLVQSFNHLGVSASYSFQVRSINSISKNALYLARQAANDPTKIKMLPYDNFNWTARAWESTALHGTLTHDEVSALLVVLPTPPGDLSAAQITDIRRFSTTEKTRHQLNPARSLADILPSAEDQRTFRKNAIIHVQHMLTEDIKPLEGLARRISSFEDNAALKPQKTEEYYLPTFDQEQGSTRGNMVVLQHYFGKVLDIPPDTFERSMFIVLGDRLTTARDRAAQDQRAVDRSEHRFDHLSSYSMVNGLMHFVLNFIEALSRNSWGSSGAVDSTCLLTLRDLLPNRQSTVNPKKIDYYAWLRFLDAILRSLVIQAALTLLEIEPNGFQQTITNIDQLQSLAEKIVDGYVLPSPTRLEALNTKTLKGDTKSGHAVTLMRDLMTLREMQHSIKYGHPTRIQRMIKFWMPMFYAAGSHNYANECMELLHNTIHDWPKEFAQVAFNGMLVNPTGEEGGWKPADLRVEHLNDRIKERAHGPNATPNLLEKITPAMGHVSLLTDQLFEDLGIEHQNQKHKEVSQHRDIEILVKHFIQEKIFVFAADKSSQHTVTDLYQAGCLRLAGQNGGGHINHLKRHILRYRQRHSNLDAGNTDGMHLTPENIELISAADAQELVYTTRDDAEDFNIITSYHGASISADSDDED